MKVHLHFVALIEEIRFQNCLFKKHSCTSLRMFVCFVLLCFYFWFILFVCLLLLMLLFSVNYQEYMKKATSNFIILPFQEFLYQSKGCTQNIIIQMYSTLQLPWPFWLCWFALKTPATQKLQSYLTAHNWQKWKRVFLTCPCHKVYRDEAVGLKSLKIYLKNYDFCENVKFGAISWKFDIWSITA